MEVTELEVSTDRLKAQAELVRKNISGIRKTLSELKRKGDNTAAYWRGEAGNSFRRRLMEAERKGDDLMSGLQAIPEDMLTMAGVYEQAEKQNIEELVSLSDNVITD